MQRATVLAMDKINTISDEQWERIHELRERYRAIGTSTAPADRMKTEAGITWAYSELGKPAPKFLWVDGPASAVLVYNVLRVFGDPESQLKDQLWEQVLGPRGSQRSARLHADQLDESLSHHINKQLWDKLWDHFVLQFGSPFEHQLGKQLGSSASGDIKVVDQLLGQLKSLINGKLEIPKFMWGGEELYWFAWLMAGEIAGVNYDQELLEKLRKWEEIFKSSGWWIPCEGLVICCERHKEIRFDAEHRLHCETGPAIECRDGYKLFAWHGTNVPAEWITDPSSLTPEMAMSWENAEQRRCAAEILGWKNILAALNCRVIDEDADPQIGTLVEVDLPNSGTERFLRVRCGTGRDFALPVPPDMKTALQANAWTYGVDEVDIQNREVRT